jgi:hypothetical protein
MRKGINIPASVPKRKDGAYKGHHIVNGTELNKLERYYFIRKEFTDFMFLLKR